MKFAHGFINRPIFAAVIAIITVILGAIAYTRLPVTQYPEVAPPTVIINAVYPGANAQTIADTVATPLEQSVNGVEGMLYMSSNSTSNGVMSLTVTFAVGTDVSKAQQDVQNRVNSALTRLPEEVRRQGVTVDKASKDFMMVIHMMSPDDSLDQLYISNYTYLRVKDQISRIDGVGSVMVFGGREYAMRVWLDPDKLASRGMTADDAVNAIRAQNVQVSGGILGQPPVANGNAFQLTITTQGRLSSVADFEQIIVRTGENGEITHLKDVARVELGAKEYGTNSYLGNKPAVAIAVMQRPGSNALQTADAVIARMDELKKSFPKGMDYTIVYNPTSFIAKSIDAVYHTIFEAIILVVLVVMLFLQSWRAAIIPILAIPVSLIGTFILMHMLGMSLNMLTLFGLVLAIGIVVDDAIVIVENMERHIEHGLTPREAAHTTINEVGGAILATTLVLCGVFIPTALMPGLTGLFYSQFAFTIAVATLVSMFNSLSLSPAMGALLLRPLTHEDKANASFFLRTFNASFRWLENTYGRTAGWIIRKAFLALVIYGVLLAGTVIMTKTVPSGFIPMQDKEYAIVVLQLPDGASLERTDAVVHRAVDIIKSIPGIGEAVAFAGFSGATFTNASNAAAIFTPFDSFEKRLAAGESQSMMALIGQMNQKLGSIQDAFVIVIPPPPVQGVGSAGGYKMMIEDRGNVGFPAMLQALMPFVGAANQTPGLKAVYTTFSASSPQVYVDIDRAKAQMLGIPLQNVFDTLQVYLGSAYVNDFNAFGRVYQVTAQADQRFREHPEDIAKLQTRNAKGELVPLGSIVTIKNTTGPELVQRYNLFPAIPVSGDTMPGFSTGESLAAMEKLANSMLPSSLGFEWTELALQQKSASSPLIVFALAVVFVFLVLAAQYESWILPLAIILIVPVAALFALLGVFLRGMDNDILTQIGMVVLIGLAAKNAILIVEFAKHHEMSGEGLLKSVVEAARTRLRPILMTSLAFILGVVPLVLATGPGAEMRQAMGTAVFSGMIGVTIFGLMLTPVFYTVLRKLTGTKPFPKHDESH